MQFGLRPLEGGTDFARTAAQVERAEELGYDSVWLAEHYTDDDQWWPASLVTLAALAGRTDDIRLGSNILITPLYNPVWLASAVAMLDQVSDGRFVCGLGVGYDPTEFSAFGVPLDERVGRTVEATIAMKKLWTEESVTYHGEHVDLEEYGVTPKPVQDPHPEVWYGVWGDYLLSQAAKRADAWVPGAVADLEQLARRQQVYDDALAEYHGADASPAQRPLVRDVVLGETRAAALERAREHLGEKYEVYAGRGHQFFADYHEVGFEAFVEDRVVLGTPDDCIEQLGRYADELGTDHFLLRFNYPGMSAEAVTADMETIAAEILPAFD
ncbi:MAG: LLM class flavin-dependent oxidoreductase [Halobacteriaceae archaeon]